MTEIMAQKTGVYQAQKKNGTIYYRSSFTWQNKHISLGSHKTADIAHNAYLAAHRLMQDASLFIYDYPANCALTFEKWVILINLRDNHIYFSTPIYVRKKYFSYYLDQNTELKFSIDDLFYYSSHKIMRRQGHFFVADYGMQVTILGRYGIKNYGVEGRDYHLLNQDPFDFRYENIEVINQYHGVMFTSHYGKLCYQSKIHIHGNYIIGYYDDAITAAIAYNKAIDVLLANGIKKQFRQNYTEGVSPSVYADIYSNIIIPNKIMNYRAE